MQSAYHISLVAAGESPLGTDAFPPSTPPPTPISPLTLSSLIRVVPTYLSAFLSPLLFIRTICLYVELVLPKFMADTETAAAGECVCTVYVARLGLTESSPQCMSTATAATSTTQL